MMASYPSCTFCGLVGTYEAPRFGYVSYVAAGVRRHLCGLCWASYFGEGR